MTAPLSAERVEELKRVLMCQADRFPEGFAGQGTRPEDFSDLLSILSDYSAMRAENERLREWSKKLEASHASLEERSRKAEAELAKVAPLVNALLRIANEAFPSEVTEKCMRSIARAALKLRSEKNERDYERATAGSYSRAE